MATRTISVRIPEESAALFQAAANGLKDLPLVSLRLLAESPQDAARLLSGGGEVPAQVQREAQKAILPAKVESAPGENDLLKLLGPAAEWFQNRAANLLRDNGLPDIPQNRVAALWHVLAEWGKGVQATRAEEADLEDYLADLRGEVATLHRSSSRLRSEAHAARREISETKQAMTLAKEMAIEEAAKAYADAIATQEARVQMLEAAINGLDARRRNPAAGLALVQETSPLALVEGVLRRQIMARIISSIA